MTGHRTFRGKPVRQINYRGRDVDYVANQLVVRLKRQLANDEDSRTSLLSILPPGSVIESDFDRLGIAVIDLPEGTDIIKVARELTEHRAVASAEPNLLDTAS